MSCCVARWRWRGERCLTSCGASLPPLSARPVGCSPVDASVGISAGGQPGGVTPAVWRGGQVRRGSESAGTLRTKRSLRPWPERGSDSIKYAPPANSATAPAQRDPRPRWRASAPSPPPDSGCQQSAGKRLWSLKQLRGRGRWGR